MTSMTTKTAETTATLIGARAGRDQDRTRADRGGGSASRLSMLDDVRAFLADQSTSSSDPDQLFLPAISLTCSGPPGRPVANGWTPSALQAIPESPRQSPPTVPGATPAVRPATGPPRSGTGSPHADVVRAESRCAAEFPMRRRIYQYAWSGFVRRLAHNSTRSTVLHRNAPSHRPSTMRAAQSTAEETRRFPRGGTHRTGPVRTTKPGPRSMPRAGFDIMPNRYSLAVDRLAAVPVGDVPEVVLERADGGVVLRGRRVVAMQQ